MKVHAKQVVCGGIKSHTLILDALEKKKKKNTKKEKRRERKI